MTIDIAIRMPEMTALKRLKNLACGLIHAS